MKLDYEKHDMEIVRFDNDCWFVVASPNTYSTRIHIYNEATEEDYTDK